MGNSPSKKKKGKNTGKPEDINPAVQATSSSSNPPNTEKSGSQLNMASSTSQPHAKVDPKPTPTKSNSIKAQEPDKGTFAIKRLEELFEKYKENDSPQIGPEGIETLCRDIGVDPENVVVLVLAWHLNAQSMGYFKKEEFINGLQALGVDTADKLKNHLKIFTSELDDPSKFKDIYRYAFGFAKEKEQKILGV
jgi:hypothetical protein